MRLVTGCKESILLKPFEASLGQWNVMPTFTKELSFVRLSHLAKGRIVSLREAGTERQAIVIRVEEGWEVAVHWKLIRSCNVTKICTLFPYQMGDQQIWQTGR